MDIKEFVANYKNHPILFIGTGFSLRYLSNSYTWDDLLSKIMFELTENNEVYLDIKSNAQNADGTFCYEKIATSVEEAFNKTLSNDRDGKFKEINDIFYTNMKNGINISRFKIYISKIFEVLNFHTEKQDEVTALKKVRKNIGSIITTNYDKLIENIFEFNPLIGNNILLSNPYGSVYKIHGCISQPDNIIITENDYLEFGKKYELIRAQLLSLFIHNPIIFIGYNVGDENIRNLLKTIFTYVTPNSKLAEKIKNNFLLVEYEQGSKNLEVYDHDIILEGNTTIRVNKIKTDNFLDIYNSIASIQLPVSAMDIRKVQGVVKEIYEGGSIQVNIVDDIDALKNGEKVLAIGNVNRISYEYQTTGEIMANYFKIIDEDNSQLLSLIDKQRIQKTQFFPIFAFAEINKTISSAEKLKTQQVDKLNTILSSLTKINKKTYTCIQEIMNDKSISVSNKSFSIMYSILNNSISLDDAEYYLINYDIKQSTEYRRILCAYDYMKYALDKTLISI